MNDAYQGLTDALLPAEAAPPPTYIAFAAPPPPADTELPPLEPFAERLNDRYRLERLLGIGGMGAVYCAHDALRARFGDPTPYVAIKVMNDRYAQYADANAVLFSEFALTQRLHHPHVIRVYDFEVDRRSQRAFIAMEWLQGTPVDRLIDEHPQGLSWQALQPVARQALEAIAHVHARGLVHGDVKPANLMLAADGVRLLDFGLSVTPHVPPGTLARLQRERIAAWTPGYAALELLEGGPLTYAADIYALACVLYELASGQHPYRRCNARHAQQQRLDRLLSCPPQLPTHSWRALRQALSLNPAHRRMTAQELLRAFQEAEGGYWPTWIRTWRAARQKR